jgi:phage shock protein A
MFKRLSNLVRGFFGLFVSGLERQNPEALLDVEKENLRRQISQYNQGLAAHAGMCERLVSQIKRQEQEEREMQAKTMANLKAGNKDAAGQYALRLQNLRRDLQDNRAQAQAAESTYQDLLRAREIAVKVAQQKIEGLKFAIDDMKIRKATAELAEMAGGLISQIGSGGDTLNRLQEIVDSERQKAAGRARVARDSMNATELSMKEAEQKALAEQALAEFAADAGIPFEPAAPAQIASAQKESIGPAQSKIMT